MEVKIKEFLSSKGIRSIATTITAYEVQKWMNEFFSSESSEIEALKKENERLKTERNDWYDAAFKSSGKVLELQSQLTSLKSQLESKPVDEDEIERMAGDSCQREYPFTSPMSYTQGFINGFKACLNYKGQGGK